MTEENGNHRKEVYALLDRVHDGRVIAQGLESSGETKLRALQERDKYGLDGLLRDEFKDGKPRYTNAELEQLSEDEVRAKIEEGFAYRQRLALSRAITTTAKNLDAIIGRNSSYDHSLTKIANLQKVIDEAPEDSQPLVRDYSQVIASQNIADKIKKGTAISKEEQEEVKKIVSAAASKKQYDALAWAPEDLRKLGAQLAGISPSEELTREELDAGAEELNREIRKQLERKYGKDYESKVLQTVGTVIKKMIDSGNPEKQQLAMNLLYKVERGYELGNQDFAEAFPKEDAKEVIYKFPIQSAKKEETKAA